MANTILVGSYTRACAFLMLLRGLGYQAHDPQRSWTPLSGGEIGFPFLWLWVSIFMAVSTPGAADVDRNPSSPALNSIALTMEDAIRLALERNRPFLNHRLDRQVQTFSLEVAEDRWTPRFAIEPFTSRDQQEHKVGIGAETRLRVPTGGEFTLRWEETLAEESADPGSQSLLFYQPLLKGAWAAMDSAEVRQARLGEKVHALALRQLAADLIVAVIDAYRALIGVGRQVEIAAASLRRAREQLQATRTLIRAGRVARREAVRSEVAVANRELALIQARNRLDVSNFRLIDILELHSTARIHPLDDLQVEPPPAQEPVLEDVLRSRADFLQATLRVDIAKILLSVAHNQSLPDLSLQLELRRDDAGQTDTLVWLGATIPLNDRLPDLGRLSAVNELRKAELNVLELRESIGIAMRRAVSDVEVGLRLTELASGARGLAEQNFVIEQKKFAQGLSSSFEVSATENDLVQTEQAEVDAIIAYHNALTQLDWIAGRTLERWNVQLEEFPE
ncbi:MAG: TolC family protein [bacterium]|nr:TolC family protein [bacterium]